jgi:hypothetical protein
MSTLAAAALGAVIGACASGLIQALLSRADRGRAGRSAARLVYMQLHGAQSEVEELQVLGEWEYLITDWQTFGHTWDRHSESLVQVLNATQSATVASAFECLASLARAREADERAINSPEPSRVFPPDKTLDHYIANLRAAKIIALTASFGRREGEQREKALAKEAEEKSLYEQMHASQESQP